MRALAAILLVAAFCLPPGSVPAQGKSEEEKAAMSLYNKGRARFDAGDWVAAEDLFAKSLTVFPNPYARLYRAASLSRLSRCPEARAELDRFSADQVSAKSRDKASRMVAQVRDACAAAPAAGKAAAPTGGKAAAPTGGKAEAPTAAKEAAPAAARAAASDSPAASAPAAGGSGVASVPSSPATPAAGGASSGEPGASEAAAIEAPARSAPVPAAAPLPGERGRLKSSVAGRPVVVSPDGKGDFTCLEEALARAKPGTVIHLAEGLHRLSKALDISSAVRLVGDGKGSTVIVGDSEGHVLRFVGPGPFQVHDLAVEHQGGRWARVIVVDGGEVDFRGLKVSGGFRDTAAKRGGEGLLLQGDATGVVTACEFAGNALHGVKLAGTAHPVLEGNTSRANGKGGIVWFEDSGGVARANNCSSNGQYGMAVVDRARPRLVGNACADNRRGGLYLENPGLEGIAENRCDPYRAR